MNFLETMLLSQASFALHAIFQTFGSKYFNADEQTAVGTVIDALMDLPRRVKAGKGAK